VALPVMTAHSPSKTGVNALLFAAIHDFLAEKQDVDGRHRAGHDDFSMA
jgi:hypothetical protein